MAALGELVQEASRRTWTKARNAVSLPGLHFHDLRHGGGLRPLQGTCASDRGQEKAARRACLMLKKSIAPGTMWRCCRSAWIRGCPQISANLRELPPNRAPDGHAGYAVPRSSGERWPDLLGDRTNHGRRPPTLAPAVTPHRRRRGGHLRRPPRLLGGKPTQSADAQRPSTGSGAAAISGLPSACQVGDYLLVTDWSDLTSDNLPSPARPLPLSRLWLRAGLLVERGRAYFQVTAHRAARHRALNTVDAVASQALEAFRCVCRRRPVLPVNGQRRVTCVLRADEEVEVLLPDLDLGAAASRPEVPDGRNWQARPARP